LRLQPGDKGGVGGKVCVPGCLGLGGVLGNLTLVLVQVEGGVKLCLLRQEFTKTRLMLEGAAQLSPVIGKGFLLALDFALLFLGLTMGSLRRRRCCGIR
jgi:hypothetical protein